MSEVESENLVIFLPFQDFSMKSATHLHIAFAYFGLFASEKRNDSSTSPANSIAEWFLILKYVVLYSRRSAMRAGSPRFDQCHMPTRILIRVGIVF